MALVDFDDFFVIPKIFYQVLGMTLYKDDSVISPYRAKLGLLLFSTTFLNINWCLLMEIVDMSTANMLELTATLTCFIFTLLGQIKIFIIWSNRKTTNDFIELMKQQFPRTSEGQAAFDVSNALKGMLFLEKLYLVVLLIGLWSFNLLSLFWSMIEYLLDSSNGFVMRFPYYKWQPFKIDNAWTYLAAYVQQMHVGVGAVNCFIAADIFLFSIISVLLMYFQYIQRQLSAMVLKRTEEDLEKLRTIMSFHQTTLNMTKLTNLVFSPTLLLSFMSSILIICLAAFQTTSQEVPVIQLVLYAMFLLHELVQTGVVCYLGQMLMDYVSNTVFLRLFSFSFHRVLWFRMQCMLKSGTKEMFNTRKWWS